MLCTYKNIVNKALNSKTILQGVLTTDDAQKTYKAFKNLCKHVNRAFDKRDKLAITVKALKAKNKALK